jgi:chitin deacetylase
MGAVAAALSFVAGCSLLMNQSVKREIAIPSILLREQLPHNIDTSQVKALIAQRDEAYSQVIARLTKENKARRLNFAVPVQFQGKTVRDVQFSRKNKASTQETLIKPIALTFDDGPWPTTTSQILDVLKKNDVKATFFIVGRQVQMYPQLLQAVVAAGHAIGNHTWSHQYSQYSESAAAHELDETAALVYKTTGVKTSLFRPPAGILNNGLVAYAHKKKYSVVMWSVDSKDWRYRGTTAQGLLENVLKDVQPGGIVLLHDGGGDRSATLEALPKLITELKKRGYTLVTVPELLEMADKN